MVQQNLLIELQYRAHKNPPKKIKKFSSTDVAYCITSRPPHGGGQSNSCLALMTVGIRCTKMTTSVYHNMK